MTVVDPLGDAYRSSRPQRLVLLARPGAGKSTLAVELSAHLGVTHLSTGALLREVADSPSSLGEEVSDVLAHGDLVRDDLVTSLVVPRIETIAAQGGYILDGYPRNARQLDSLERLVSRDAQPELAVYLDVNEEVCRQRLVRRAEIEHRSDDSPATIDHRLAAFEAEVAPLVALYESHGRLVSVGGDALPEVVLARTMNLLGRSTHRSPISRDQMPSS